MQNSSHLTHVSDNILLEGSLPIYAYFFKQGDQPITALHQHDVIELGLCHSGCGIFMIEEKIIPYQAGDICVINEKEMHLARSHDGTTSDWTFIHFDAQRLLAPMQSPELSSENLCGKDFCNILHGHEHPLLSQLISALIDEINSEPNLHKKPALQSLVWSCMIQLQRLPHTKHTTHKTQQSIESIAPAIEYMSAHFAEDIKIPELADRCSVSHVHFNRLFKSACGMSAKAYLNKLRIEIACSLLSTSNQSILHISLDCGYSTLSTFNRQFQQHMRCSPRSYRQTHATPATPSTR